MKGHRIHQMSIPEQIWGKAVVGALEGVRPTPVDLRRQGAKSTFYSR